MVTGIRNEEAPPWSNEPLPRMAHCDSGSLQLWGHHVLTNTQIQIHQSKHKYVPFSRIVYSLQIHLPIIFPPLQNILIIFCCCKKRKLGRNQKCKYLSRLR